mmetsp:Transcript_62103/g.103201  ORF Transcript_62103/g.103201 Transcript_62103/m.103201 type:complete len:183 (+) Transcript_62103:483-1031(+)
MRCKQSRRAAEEVATHADLHGFAFEKDWAPTNFSANLFGVPRPLPGHVRIYNVASRNTAHVNAKGSRQQLPTNRLGVFEQLKAAKLQGNANTSSKTVSMSSDHILSELCTQSSIASGATDPKASGACSTGAIHRRPQTHAGHRVAFNPCLIAPMHTNTFSGPLCDHTQSCLLNGSKLWQSEG